MLFRLQNQQISETLQLDSKLTLEGSIKGFSNSELSTSIDGISRHKFRIITVDEVIRNPTRGDSKPPITSPSQYSACVVCKIKPSVRQVAFSGT